MMREPKTSSFLRFIVAGGSCLAVLCIASSQALAADPPPPPPPNVIPPPPPPPDEKKLEVMAWSRIGATFQSPYDTTSLNKLTANGELDIFAHGKVTDEIGIFGSLIASFGPEPGAGGAPGGAITGAAAIEDVVIQLEPSDYFHVWLGRMLVASDRSNFSGPWHISPWLYPGFFSLPPGNASATYLVGQGAAPPIGPRQGPVGRNDGVTVWGQYMGGLFKYYLGMYNLQDAGGTPLWSGRVSLSLLNPEPGYFNASTYYGAKDIIGLGLGAQVQGNGSRGNAAPPSDYTEVNFDVLAEKNFGAAGVGTAEGAFYKYGGDNEPYDFSYFVLVSYLTPQKIGPGKIQPLLRLQQAKPKPAGFDTQTIFDVQAGYVVEGFKARFSIGYENSNFGAGVKGNAILLGAQVQR
jgi:hypothetical protein